MADLVVWTGPVAPFQVPGATVDGAQELFITCRGDRGPHAYCPDIGEVLRSSPAVLAARAGAEIDNLYLGAFSAGGSILKRLLENSGYRDATAAVLLSDATYTTGWDNVSERIPPPIEGFVQYAVDVAKGPGDKLFIATASPMPNKNWATGVETLASIRHEVERRTGRSFELVDGFFDIEPQPARTYKLGNVIFAEYPAEPLGHGHTIIAPQVWQEVLQEWVDKGKGPIDQPGGLIDPTEPPQPQPADDGIGMGGVLLGLVGAGAGFFIISKLLKRRG